MSRIYDLGAVATTAALDRSDGDIFKMSTSSGSLSLTFGEFEDGDRVVLQVEYTGGPGALSVSVSNSVAYEYGSGGISVSAGRSFYAEFRLFDGKFVETSRNYYA